MKSFFGKKFGFDVDKDTFMAVSFLYPSDAYVTGEDKELLKACGRGAMIHFSEINKKIGGSQVMMADMGLVVILMSHSKRDMRYMLKDLEDEALRQLEKLDSRYARARRHRHHGERYQGHQAHLQERTGCSGSR